MNDNDLFKRIPLLADSHPIQYKIPDLKEQITIYEKDDYVKDNKEITSCKDIYYEKDDNTEDTKGIINNLIVVSESDLYMHSFDILNALNNIRESPNKYCKDLTNLQIRHPGSSDKANYEMQLTIEGVNKTKMFLKKISEQNVDCIMWNERLFQALNFYANDIINNDNCHNLISLLHDDFPNFKIIDFTSFNYVDPVDSILIFLNENEIVRKKLLCENYHYGAVTCGFNNENNPFCIIVLCIEKE